MSSGTGNEFFTGIFYAPTVHQKNAPSNRSVPGVDQNPPVKSSTLAEALPWVNGTDHSFYTDWWVASPTVPSKVLTLPAGVKPYSVSVTGTVTTNAAFGTLDVGLATTSGGSPTVVLASITMAAAGVNVINSTLDVNNILPLTSLMYVVFEVSGTDITAVSTELSPIIRYDTA